jgi:hypothetical protein
MHLPCTCHAHPKVAIGLITANLVLSYPIVLNPPERARETTQGRTLKRAGGSGRRSTPSVEGGPLPPPTTASGARARRLQRRRFHRRQPSRLEVRLGLTRAWPLLGLRLLVRSSFMLLTAGIATVLTPPQVRAGAPLLCMRVCLSAPLSMSPLSSEPPFLSPLSAYTRCCTMLHPLPPPLRPRAPYCTLNLSTLTTVRPLPRPGLRLHLHLHCLHPPVRLLPEAARRTMVSAATSHAPCRGGVGPPHIVRLGRRRWLRHRRRHTGARRAGRRRPAPLDSF